MIFNLQPLIPFADSPGQPWSPPPLSSTPHDPSTLKRIIGYLDNATLVYPWMEYTEDLIGGKFGVPGGSATMSDGTYYWRYDAVEYLKHYPIRIPEEAIKHFESKNWRPLKLDFKSEEFKKLEKALDLVYKPRRKG
ncbi:hypothetical protein [Propionibacterium australiense]|nr:hypothetical protein [Propionibacterium australiense]